MPRTVVRAGLFMLLTIWYGMGLMSFWLFGVTERQYIDASVEAFLAPVHVARFIAVHGFGYDVPEEFIYGTPEHRAQAAEEDRRIAAREAAGCSGWNPNCKTPEEEAAARKEAEERYARRAERERRGNRTGYKSVDVVTAEDVAGAVSVDLKAGIP